jgi:hypothetical protein
VFLGDAIVVCDDMHKVINLKDGKKTVASDIPQDRITILLLQFMPSGGSLNYKLTNLPSKFKLIT